MSFINYDNFPMRLNLKHFGKKEKKLYCIMKKENHFKKKFNEVKYRRSNEKQNYDWLEHSAKLAYYEKKTMVQRKL